MPRSTVDRDDAAAGRVRLLDDRQLDRQHAVLEARARPLRVDVLGEPHLPLERRRTRSPSAGRRGRAPAAACARRRRRAARSPTTTLHRLAGRRPAARRRPSARAGRRCGSSRRSAGSRGGARRSAAPARGPRTAPRSPPAACRRRALRHRREPYPPGAPDASRGLQIGRAAGAAVPRRSPASPLEARGARARRPARERLRSRSCAAQRPVERVGQVRGSRRRGPGRARAMSATSRAIDACVAVDARGEVDAPLRARSTAGWSRRRSGLHRSAPRAASSSKTSRTASSECTRSASRLLGRLAAPGREVVRDRREVGDELAGAAARAAARARAPGRAARGRPRRRSRRRRRSPSPRSAARRAARRSRVATPSMNSAAIGTSRFGALADLQHDPGSVRERAARARRARSTPIATCTSPMPMPTPANTPTMRPSETETAANGSPVIATSGTSAAKIGRFAPSSPASHQARGAAERHLQREPDLGDEVAPGDAGLAAHRWQARAGSPPPCGASPRRSSRRRAAPTPPTPEDPARSLDLRGRRRIDLVADRDLRGVDAPLAVVAVGAGAERRPPEPRHVVERHVRAVDRREPERARGDGDAERARARRARLRRSSARGRRATRPGRPGRARAPRGPGRRRSARSRRGRAPSRSAPRRDRQARELVAATRPSGSTTTSGRSSRDEREVVG